MAHSKAKRLTNDLISKSTLAQLIVLFSKANPALSKRGKNLLVLDPSKLRDGLIFDRARNSSGTQVQFTGDFAESTPRPGVEFRVSRSCGDHARYVGVHLHGRAPWLAEARRSFSRLNGPFPAGLRPPKFR